MKRPARNPSERAAIILKLSSPIARGARRPAIYMSATLYSNFISST